MQERNNPHISEYNNNDYENSDIRYIKGGNNWDIFIV